MYVAFYFKIVGKNNFLKSYFLELRFFPNDQ